MVGELKVVSDTRSVTGGHLVFEDYDSHPRACRHGVWSGWKETFSQTVTLAFDHVEHPYVGWSVNGVTVIDPGYGPFTQPPGVPCPGAPSVLYSCPVGGLFHQISFTSSSGAPRACFWVQVIYREHGEQNLPPHEGPGMTVCVSGSDVEWPAFLVAEERACLRRWWDILRRYVEVADVGPLDPVEFLTRLPADELAMLQAAAQTLEKINADEQPRLSNGLRDTVLGILRARMPGAAASTSQRPTAD
jgi:hypothetical protein